jgi:outer membrane protein
MRSPAAQRLMSRGRSCQKRGVAGMRQGFGDRGFTVFSLCYEYVGRVTFVHASRAFHMLRLKLLLLTSVLVSAAGIACSAAQAQDSSWYSGEWSLSLGAAAYVAPNYVGDDEYELTGMPLISLGRKDSVTRFSSLNDSASIAVFDAGFFRIGPTARILLPRDNDDSDDLDGLDDVPWGIEAGIFAYFYPTDWVRLRTEIRHGIHAHHGIVADFAIDAFTDLTPVIRLSAGPRLSVATASYFETYYGVDAQEAIDSGLSPYDPGGGLNSVGFGGALTWQATDKIQTSIFGEYSRLLGPAADSSLVEERGSENQFKVGVSATYRFDFTL